MNADSSGPAFPNMAQFDSKNCEFVAAGMSLRDYFAAKAMPALIEQLPRQAPPNRTWTQNEIAVTAYGFADAMLQARQS